ncbi:MAG: hypothetical protein U9Q37_02855 [Euryarchaeota archaeon]|nr:hypothetical protein [Euryarchaeota archaeon]
MPSNTELVQFGTEQFVAAATKDDGIPDHAIQIEGRLIHLGQKNLAGWGVTADATDQILKAIPGVPIRACAAQNPHECDFAYDNKSHIGYGVRAWVKDDWIHAAAAITDKDAVKHVADGTWLPFGKGGWSVAGIPTAIGDDFEDTGMVTGYQPSGVSLVFAPAEPAFIGSGFGMVAAAVYDHNNGDDMTETEDNMDAGDPVTYTQADLDQHIEAVKSELDAKIKTLETEKADAATEAEKQGIDAMLSAKKEYDARLEAMTAEEKASYDAQLADMTPKADVEAMVAEMVPKADVEAMIAAAVAQGHENTLETIERDKLIGEYREMLGASVVLSAPFMVDGALDPAKLDAEMAAVGEMKVAAITEHIDKQKMIAAAAMPAGQTPFDAANVPSLVPTGGVRNGFTVGDCKGGDN